MKVYIHYEGATEATFTMVAVVESGTTAQDLAKVFLEAYKTEDSGAANLRISQVTFCTEKRRRLPHDAVIEKLVQDKSDLYVSIHTNPSSEQPASLPETSSSTCHENPPINDSDLDIDLLLKEADCAYQNSEASTAVTLCNQVIKLHPDNLDALNKLVDIYLSADRGKKALQYAKLAARVHKDDLQQKFRVAECYLACKHGDKALAALLEYSKELRAKGDATAELKHDLQVALCQAYQLQQQRDMALVVIQGVLKETREHLPALVEYARLTWDLGSTQASEVAIILINALIAWQENKKIKEYMAEFCSKHNGLKYLEVAMAEAWKSVPSLVYIASTLRDGGAVEQACQVMRKALSIDPTHVSALLTYVHMLEVMDEHTEGFQEIRQYLDFEATHTLDGVLLDNFYRCVANLEGNIYLNDYEFSVEQVPGCEAGRVPYTEADLYLLALLFTLVKILFVKGALGIIKPLTKLLDPLHSDRQLHTTLIRNEAAYYGCISKIMSTTELKQASKEDRFIYMVGDSHCISPAWATLQYQGVSHTIHPVLSTGTKIWHLRRESVFYPKVNYENGIKVIPDGATTIFSFGEIDCREALLTCVEKCRYDTVDEAIRAVVDIYLDVLRQHQREHNWVIYVHPVPPVLDLTRSTVTAFNTHLQRRLSRLSTTQIRWLPILDQLLTPDRTALYKQYEFDGTHLNPNYVRLLESAMQEN